MENPGSPPPARGDEDAAADDRQRPENDDRREHHREHARLHGERDQADMSRGGGAGQQDHRGERAQGYDGPGEHRDPYLPASRSAQEVIDPLGSDADRSWDATTVELQKRGGKGRPALDCGYRCLVGGNLGEILIAASQPGQGGKEEQCVSQYRDHSYAQRIAAAGVVGLMRDHGGELTRAQPLDRAAGEVDAGTQEAHAKRLRRVPGDNGHRLLSELALLDDRDGSQQSACRPDLMGR